MMADARMACSSSKSGIGVDALEFSKSFWELKGNLVMREMNLLEWVNNFSIQYSGFGQEIIKML